MIAGPWFDRYPWAAGDEAMLRFGPAHGPVVVVAPPLFEEANRTRAVAAALLRALAGHAIAGALPDLPGQGDSLLPTKAMTLAMVREAFAAAVAAVATEGRPVHVAAIRSGALLGPAAGVAGRWHLAPQDGPTLVRELTRIKQYEAGRDGRLGERWYLDTAWSTDAGSVSIAGNPIAPQFLNDLANAIGFGMSTMPKRTVRLEGDQRPADCHITGAPPWRRAEPGGDDALAQLLAGDLAAWVGACAAR